MRIYNILIIVVVGLPVAARLRVEEVVQSRRPFRGNAAAVKGSVAGSAFAVTCFIVTCPTHPLAVMNPASLGYTPVSVYDIHRSRISAVSVSVRICHTHLCTSLPRQVAALLVKSLTVCLKEILRTHYCNWRGSASPWKTLSSNVMRVTQRCQLWAITPVLCSLCNEDTEINHSTSSVNICCLVVRYVHTDYKIR